MNEIVGAELTLKLKVHTLIDRESLKEWWDNDIELYLRTCFERGDIVIGDLFCNWEDFKLVKAKELLKVEND